MGCSGMDHRLCACLAGVLPLCYTQTKAVALTPTSDTAGWMTSDDNKSSVSHPKNGSPTIHSAEFLRVWGWYREQVWFLETETLLPFLLHTQLSPL